MLFCAFLLEQMAVSIGNDVRRVNAGAEAHAQLVRLLDAAFAHEKFVAYDPSRGQDPVRIGERICAQEHGVFVGFIDPPSVPAYNDYVALSGGVLDESDPVQLAYLDLPLRPQCLDGVKTHKPFSAQTVIARKRGVISDGGE